MKTLSLAFFMLLVAPGYSAACQFDSDCEVGSTCVKNGGIYGYCMGGMRPGNTYDDKPATDMGGGGGYTCSFSSDCDIGYTCVKSGLKGVCLKR
jgi:hypothetical protein